MAEIKLVHISQFGKIESDLPIVYMQLIEIVKVAFIWYLSYVFTGTHSESQGCPPRYWATCRKNSWTPNFPRKRHVQVYLIKNPTISKCLNFPVKKKGVHFSPFKQKCVTKGLTVWEFFSKFHEKLILKRIKGNFESFEIFVQLLIKKLVSYNNLPL